MPKTVRINVPQQLYSDTEEVVDDGDHSLHTYNPASELPHVTTMDNALFRANTSDDESRRDSFGSRGTPAADGQNVGLSQDGHNTDASLAPTNMNHTLPAPGSRGLGIRDFVMQLTPELRHMMLQGECNPEGNRTAPNEAPARVASVPEDLAIQELPSLLTLHPDDVMTPGSANKAAARWKKGNIAVTANRFLRGAQPDTAHTEEDTDPGIPQNHKGTTKKRKKLKKVKHPNIVKKADAMTELLRVGWSPKRNTIPAHTDEERKRTAAARQKIELLAEDAIKAGPMTLWDVLSGKVASRIPNLHVGPQAPWSAWDPCSKYRSRWDALCCLLVFYMALTLPVEVAFVTTSPGIDAWSLISYCIDALFVADIYIHLRTGYFQQDKETGMWSLQLCPRACAFRYMRGWFIVDVLSVVPFEPLLPSQKGLSINLSQLPRCLKLLRLPRLFRCELSGAAAAHGLLSIYMRRGLLWRYIKKWQELIPVSSILMQLSTTICVMLLFAHVAACALVLAAKLEGLPDGSWMVQYDLTEKSAFIQYLYALFISTSHLFCLGYGLPTMPGSLVELCVTLVSMIVGSVLFLVVVGTLPTAILEQEVSAAAQELEGDHVPLPTARAAHDRARLASMVGMFSPAFRSSVMHSVAMHDKHLASDDPHSVARVSHKGAPPTSGGGRVNQRRGGRTTFAGKAHLHHEQDPAIQPLASKVCSARGEIDFQD